MLISTGDQSALDWPFISGYAYQCPICSGMTSQAYQWGETARSAQQTNDRAHARTISPAHQSTAITIRNNQRPYHWNHHNCHRRYVLKYLHLGLNSRAHLAAHGRQFSSAGTVGVSCCHRITPVSAGNRAQQFCSPNCGRIAPVGAKNRRQGQTVSTDTNGGTYWRGP